MALGILPALLWLWFWLKEDRLHPEPRSHITLALIGGMLAVPFVYFIQKSVAVLMGESFATSIAWAGAEEVMKFLIAYFLVLKSKFNDEPVDAMIYLTTAAIGFAGLENTLFILSPLADGNTLGGLVTGNLRFMGATLLHIVASASVGVWMGLAFYKSGLTKFFAAVWGLILATALHTTFNYFIMEVKGSEAFLIFGGVWFAVVMILLSFEKVKQVA